MKAVTLTVLAMLSAVPMVGIAAQPAEGNSDHQQMLAKLKITSPLRPGPAGRLNADGTVPSNYANYDESKATAGSPVPPLLVMNDGRKITALTMREERIVQMTPLERLDQAYWLAFFGEPYLDMFGKEKLLSVQCYSIE